MEIKDKLNVNEVIASALLIVFSFGVYYLDFYPHLVSEYETKYWHTPSSSVEDKETGTCLQDSDGVNGIIYFNLKFPKYMADFIDRNISLKIENNTDKNQKGVLLIESQLVTKETLAPIKYSSIDLIIDGEYKEFFEVDLPSCAAQTYSIQSLVPRYERNQDLYAQFNLSYREQNAQDGAAYIKKNLIWDLVPDTCVAKAKGVKNNGEMICAEVKAEQVLLHTAIENLLLPPWSNGLIPVFVIAIVWISTRVFPGNRKKREQDFQEFKLLEVTNILVLSLFFIIVFITIVWSTFFIKGFDISYNDLHRLLSGLFILSALPLLGSVFFKTDVVQIVISPKNFIKLVWVVLIVIAIVNISNPVAKLLSPTFDLNDLKLIRVGLILLLLPYAIRGILWVLYWAYEIYEVPICNCISYIKDNIQPLFSRLNQIPVFYLFVTVFRAVARPIQSIKGLAAKKRAHETDAKEDWEIVVNAFPQSNTAIVRLRKKELRSIDGKKGYASRTKNLAAIDELIAYLDELRDDEKFRNILGEQYDIEYKDLEKRREEIIDEISRFTWFIHLNDYHEAYNIYKEIRANSKTTYLIDEIGLFREEGGIISVEKADVTMHVKYLQWLREEIQEFLAFCKEYKEQFPEEIRERSESLVKMIDNLSEEDKKRFVWWRGLLVKSAQE